MQTLTMKYAPVKNFIAGQFIEEQNQEFIEVISPTDGSVLSVVPMSTRTTLDKAVLAAQKAFTQWSTLSIKERTSIFYKYRDLLLTHLSELSMLITEENGKTYSESKAEIEKSIELTEFACSLPQLIAGQTLEVSRGIECKMEYIPLGVVASIVPFNFPSMVPHWTLPNALVLGNTMVIKPSEQVPLSMIRIAELLKEAGLPDGVLNIVNGGKTIVEAICDHPDIEAVSFVGSTKVAKLVYKRATASLKRALTLGGAKNHLFVLPDAHLQMTASNIVASATGCAGQRCMAASVMLAVGNVDPIIELICTEAQKLTCGINLGAIINKSNYEKIKKYIDDAEAAGADILVDGRDIVVNGKEKGFYIGPTIIDRVRPDMAIAREEVFGPVLCIIHTDTLDEALAIENANPYGNAAGVFTQNGAYAKYISQKAGAGMIGVNIGVPVPREPFSFGGWNESKFGACDITGENSLGFWTKLRKITTKWNPEAGANWMS